VNERAQPGKTSYLRLEAIKEQDVTVRVLELEAVQTVMR
jgi:hypothetical protein